MNLAPSLTRHAVAAVVAVATAVAAAGAATAASDVVILVALVWLAVAVLAATKAVTLTRAIIAYRRAYRTGQEHARWAADLTWDTVPHVAGVE
ncbi:hypothetical protein [Nonomuraea basaltis]|uniref:hypothetical protein n=1 Tax=Nonomuraea basaltis TaxID=2495887 RepID=UPI00110C5540|nr:hypothetical protein [Nonomuraea basaltis]TMR99565.1 hypothetical protein EJK15_07060 [Nonomuraea basaltis]